MFAGLYLSIISTTNKNLLSTPADVTKGTGFGARVGVGVAYALSPRFTAVGQYGLLGFYTAKYKLNETDYYTNSGFDFGVNTTGASRLSQGNGSGSVFNIGLYYTFMP